MTRPADHLPGHIWPRRHVRPLAGIIAALVVVGGAAVLALPALAGVPDATVTVTVSQTGKTPTHAGAGFLYGLNQDGSGPGDSLMQPIAPTLFRGGGSRLSGGGWIGDGYTAGSGYSARIASALGQARRVTRGTYRATYHLLVSDLYGADTTQPANTVYPCDNGNCGNWTTFIDRVVADVQASGLSVAYDIWNEPDGTGFWQRGVNSAQYFQMWDTAVREIRRLSPSAAVVGPSYSGYNHTWLDQFLGRTNTDGTVPTVLNWHFGNDPASDSADAASLVSAHGLAPIPQSINEYLFGNQQNAGYTAWFLDRLAVSGVSTAAHAIWTDCCVAGTLDSILAGTGVNAAPTGQWWVYRAYASLTGAMVNATSGNAGIAVAAAADQNTAQANILIGNNSGQTGITTITVNGLSATPWLAAGATVHATLLRIPDQTPLSTPITVTDTDVTITNGSISLPATFQSATDAFWLTLSPHGTGPVGGGTSIVDGNSTGTGNNQFQYGANWGLTTGVTDMYAGTANWSFVSGATATFRFTGTQVALHAVKDIDQGIMSITIDGGAPQNLDDYAPNRNAFAIVWISPVLSSASHTITITNTGQRNPASSGNTIAIDRADITSGGSGAGGPYGGTAAAVPGVVQAENYDTGGQGAGYSVNSVNGSANSYRPDGIDLEATTDTGGGYDVGWTARGQWFRYTVNVASAGTYTLNMRVAAPNAVSDALHVTNASGSNLTGGINIPATGGWQNWTTIATQLTLPVGQQILTLAQDNGGWNINNLQFTTTSGSTTPTNLAAGKPTSESSQNQTYASANATDADQNTYWESANNAFPQWLQTDLGSAQNANRIFLQLPASWGARSQTLTVLASTDGTNFTTVVGSTTYTFDPSSNNTVTITFPATSQRYLRLNITANTGWPAGQISSFQVWDQ